MKRSVLRISACALLISSMSSVYALIPRKRADIGDLIRNIQNKSVSGSGIVDAIKKLNISGSDLNDPSINRMDNDGLNYVAYNALKNQGYKLNSMQVVQDVLSGNEDKLPTIRSRSTLERKVLTTDVLERYLDTRTSKQAQGYISNPVQKKDAITAIDNTITLIKTTPNEPEAAKTIATLTEVKNNLEQNKNNNTAVSVPTTPLASSSGLTGVLSDMLKWNLGVEPVFGNTATTTKPEAILSNIQTDIAKALNQEGASKVTATTPAEKQEVLEIIVKHVKAGFPGLQLKGTESPDEIKKALNAYFKKKEDAKEIEFMPISGWTPPVKEGFIGKVVNNYLSGAAAHKNDNTPVSIDFAITFQTPADIGEPLQVPLLNAQVLSKFNNLLAEIIKDNKFMNSQAKIQYPESIYLLDIKSSDRDISVANLNDEFKAIYAHKYELKKDDTNELNAALKKYLLLELYGLNAVFRELATKDRSDVVLSYVAEQSHEFASILNFDNKSVIDIIMQIRGTLNILADAGVKDPLNTLLALEGNKALAADLNRNITTVMSLLMGVKGTNAAGWSIPTLAKSGNLDSLNALLEALANNRNIQSIVTLLRQTFGSLLPTMNTPVNVAVAWAMHGGNVYCVQRSQEVTKIREYRNNPGYFQLKPSLTRSSAQVKETYMNFSNALNLFAGMYLDSIQKELWIKGKFDLTTHLDKSVAEQKTIIETYNNFADATFFGYNLNSNIINRRLFEKVVNDIERLES